MRAWGSVGRHRRAAVRACFACLQDGNLYDYIIDPAAHAGVDAVGLLADVAEVRSDL